MYTSKRFSYGYDDVPYEEIENGNKGPHTIVADIMADPDFSKLEEVVIGCWGEAWDEKDGSAQNIIDSIVENKDKFSHIKSLFIGDMDYEDCEVSWIIQADYSTLWDAMPQLEKLIIKGSTGLELGTIKHDNLKHLEIICGGLPIEVIESITKADLPNLETLLLYLGVEDYGFDAEPADIEALLKDSNFPKLTYLGLTDSEQQDELAEMVFESKYINQINTLDLSKGTLTDEGGQVLLDKLPSYPNITNVMLDYHFMSDEMMEKLDDLSGVDVSMDEQQEADVYDGEVYYYPMLTE